MPIWHVTSTLEYLLTISYTFAKNMIIVTAKKNYFILDFMFSTIGLVPRLQFIKSEKNFYFNL